MAQLDEASRALGFALVLALELALELTLVLASEACHDAEARQSPD